MCKWCEGSGMLQAKRRGTDFVYGFRCDCGAAERRHISSFMVRWSDAMDRTFMRDFCVGVAPESYQPKVDYKLKAAGEKDFELGL